jgi:predicted metal-dependent hydrolase
MPLFQIAEVQVELVRKPIQRLRMTVYAPDGRVRVTAPMRMPVATIEEFVAARRAWIQKHQARFAAMERPISLAYETGETHFYQGRGYRLQVHEGTGRPHVVLHEEEGCLDIYIAVGSTAAQRAQVLAAWYRARLKAQLPALVAKWEPVVGVHAQAWAIKQMTTRWGTCNTVAKRIWLNLELIKRPGLCLEYVVVHELVHLHERLHNARFWGLMDRFMPEWRQYKAELNQVLLRSGNGADAD